MSNPWDEDLIRCDGRAIAHVWEAGLDEAYDRGWQDVVTPDHRSGIDCTDAFAHGADWGAGWLAAILGRDSFESAKLTTGEFNEP